MINTDQLKKKAKSTYYRTKQWLNQRYNRKYYNWNAFFMNCLWVVLLSILLLIIYSNLEKLNKITLWFIRLGGTLFLIIFIIWIKYTYKLSKRIYYWFKGERNWVRYLTVFILLFLVWQAHNQKETLFDPVVDFYESEGLSYLSPFYISPEEKLSIKSSIKDTKKDSQETLSDFVKIFEPKLRDVKSIEKIVLKMVNEERSKYGAGKLSINNNLQNFARSWSEKMIKQGFFEHSNMGFSYNSYAGENIMQTPQHSHVMGCGSTYDNENMAACIVNGWIESPGHHKNMIDPKFSHTGIGVACNSLECKSTQVFQG